MDSKYYDPKIAVILGVVMIVFAFLMPFFWSSSDKFIRGVIFGIGLGTVLSNLYRVFKLDKENT